MNILEYYETTEEQLKSFGFNVIETEDYSHLIPIEIDDSNSFQVFIDDQSRLKINTINAEGQSRQSKPYGILRDTPSVAVMVVYSPIEAVVLSKLFPQHSVIATAVSNFSSFRFQPELQNALDAAQDILLVGFKASQLEDMQKYKFHLLLGVEKIKIIDIEDFNKQLFSSDLVTFIEDKSQTDPFGLLDLGEFATLDYINASTKCFAKTGIFSVDKGLRGIREKELTILTGRNSEGKSTLLSQILINQLKADFRTFLYSGEMNTAQVSRWLAIQMLSDPKDYELKKDDMGNEERIFNYGAINRFRSKINGKLIVYDESASPDSLFHESFDTQSDELLYRMRIAYKRYNAKLFIIDNLMSAVEDSESDSLTARTNFVKQLTQFKNQYPVHVILCAHPTKSKGNNDSLERFDILGSSDIGNLADNIISIIRIYKKDLKSATDRRHRIDGEISILKNRMYGDTMTTGVLFDKETKTFKDVGYDGNGLPGDDPEKDMLPTNYIEPSNQNTLGPQPSSNPPKIKKFGKPSESAI